MLKLLGISTEDLQQSRIIIQGFKQGEERTLGKCLKYYKDGVDKKVKAEKNPFIVEKSHFADAKYYKKKNKPQDIEGPETPQMPLAFQTATPALQKSEEDIIEVLKRLTLPLTQPEKVAASPLKGFVTPQEGPKIEHDTMGPKAYDLLLKAEYDPIKDKAMG
ncbi:hypothetical protein LIER_13889 [Lithospermum erythrorhizon]|uniref:Uncharacterized protein n=1 Tax=Lithospermum erythrorhizon TaxID=34254 RepID=A0AAV3PZC3_LITER